MGIVKKKEKRIHMRRRKNNFTHNLDNWSSSVNAVEGLPRWPSGRDGLAGLPLGHGHGHLVPSRGREAASRLLHHGLGHLPVEGPG